MADMSSFARSGLPPVRPLRILLVSNLFPPHVVGGAEVVAWRQACELRACGHAVTVFAGWIAEDAAGHGCIERQEADGLVIWRIGLASLAPDENFRNARTAAYFKAVIEAERPDIVHFHNIVGLGADLIALVRRRGIPSVVTMHDPWGVCYRATMLRPDGSLCQNTQECGICCAGTIRPHDAPRAAADAPASRLCRVVSGAMPID